MTSVLSHIASEYCLADPLTKHTAKPDQLVFSITTGSQARSG
jgi:hypothetical protein